MRYSNPHHHSVYKLRAEAKTKYIAEIGKPVFSRSRIALKSSIHISPITLILSNSDPSESRRHFLSTKFTDQMKIEEVKSRGKKFWPAVKEASLRNECVNAGHRRNVRAHAPSIMPSPFISWPRPRLVATWNNKDRVNFASRGYYM